MGFPPKILLLSLASAIGTYAAVLNTTWGPPIFPVHGPPKLAPKTDHVTDVDGAKLPPLTTVYYFDQLIDHANPSLGTFKQRYWHTWEWYKSGGPIVLFTPGESNAEDYTGFLTNGSIVGLIAQQQKGATVVLEHRYYGESNPYSDLSVDSLRYHTIPQAIEDLDYFANNVNLTMPGGNNVKPDSTNWVLVGGSYSGALVSWTMVAKPDLFRAGYSSSGVVQAITDFWAYFEPIRKHMPQNCSADIEAVIAHVDEVFMTGTPAEIRNLKATFGMQNVTHLDDAVSSFRWVLWKWQNLGPATGPGSDFYKFCDVLEVQDGKSAPSSGWGLQHALQAWGNYWNTTFLYDTCGGYPLQYCLNTYNPYSTTYTDTSVGNANRAWRWTVCNFVGWYQTGAPADRTIVSRLIQPEYEERQCTYYFPTAFGNDLTPDPETAWVNTAYQGWYVDVDRLFFANGERDPWLEATVSASDSPTTNSSTQPIALSTGFHCSDLITANAYYDPTIATVHRQALASMKSWLTNTSAAAV